MWLPFEFLQSSLHVWYFYRQSQYHQLTKRPKFLSIPTEQDGLTFVAMVMQILIAIIIGWLVSGLMTYFDVLSSDRDSVQFYARTDTQIHVITNSPWFSFPYPGQCVFVSWSYGDTLASRGETCWLVYVYILYSCQIHVSKARWLATTSSSSVQICF